MSQLKDWAFSIWVLAHNQDLGGHVNAHMDEEVQLVGAESSTQQYDPAQASAPAATLYIEAECKRMIQMDDADGCYKCMIQLDGTDELCRHTVQTDDTAESDYIRLYLIIFDDIRLYQTISDYI